MIPATESCRKDGRKSPHPAGKHRKSPELGSNTPGENCPDFFPADSCQLPVLSVRNRAESIEKNPKFFWLEYCLRKITGITRNRPFRGRTVRRGKVDKIVFFSKGFIYF